MNLDLDPTVHAQRTRFRGLTLILVGVTVIAGVIACTAGTGPVRHQLQSHYGDYLDDDGLDANPSTVDALIVTKDTYEQVHVLSYEYFHGRSIYVGYQRMDAPAFALFEIGDLVPADLLEAQPSVARLRGTTLEPRATVTRWFDYWNRAWSVLLWLPTTLALIGVGVGSIWAVRPNEPM